MSVLHLASLREHRQRAGERLADVAALVGRSVGAMGRIERGQQHASVEVLELYHRRYRWGIRDAAR